MKFLKLLSLAFCLTMISPVFANNPVTFNLWEKDSPKFESGLAADAEVVENPGWISLVTNPVLYVYPAEKPNGTAMLMCPGGGYYGVAIKHEGKDLAEILNDNGITLAVLKYRMPNGNYNVPSEDVIKALEILHQNASEWGIDPKRIGIGGASAGGHLASTVATHLEGMDFKPAFQFLLYPVITMDNSFTHQGSREALLGSDPSDELVKAYSNELQVSSDTPPTFIAVSANDNVVPVKNSIDYFNALKDNGVPVSLFIYPTGGHGWGYNPDFIHYKEWTAEMIHWFNTLFANKTQSY